MSAVGFASGLNASGRGGGSDPLGQLLTYKTNQDMLEVRKQQLAQQNEQFAKSLEFSNREHDFKTKELNHKIQQDRELLRLQEQNLQEQWAVSQQKRNIGDQELRTLQLKNAQLEQEVEQLQKLNFRQTLADKYYGSMQTGDWNATLKFLKSSPFGEPVLEYVGGNIDSTNKFSDAEILKLVGGNPEMLQQVRANPQGYIVVGDSQNRGIISTEDIFSQAGLFDYINAYRLKKVQSTFILNQAEKLSQGGDPQQIAQNVAAMNSLNQPDASLKAFKEFAADANKGKENEIKKEQNFLKAMELAQKAANDSNKGRINTELANATSQEVLGYIKSLVVDKQTDAAIVIGKTYLHNKYEALAKELGRDPTQQEVIASLDDTGGFIFNWLKQTDKRFDELSKAQTTQSGILSNEVSTAVLSAAVNGMNKILDEKGSIFSWVRKYFPSLESTLSNFNNMFGGQIFAGDENAAEDWKKAIRDKAASFNFMVLYTKYVSGVAFREDEVDRINTIFSQFGDSMGQRATLIKDAIERQLNGLLAQKALDPLTFTLYRGNELVRLKTLYAMAQEWEKLAGIKDPKDREEAIRKSQKVLEPYYQTLKSLGYVVDIPKRLDNTPTAKGVTPKVLPSSSTANLLKQQRGNGEVGTPPTSNNTQTNKKNPADLLQPANEPPEATEYTEEQLNAIKWLD